MSETPTARLEAFSDGVFAIAMTLLILDIKFPPAETIGSTQEFWLALGRLAPALGAFVLSFTIILITWVNHHSAFKLVRGTCVSAIYANGFLLLTVVFLPFPTALVGQYLLTDYAAPAVILYDGIQALQAAAWILMGSAALKNNLAKNEASHRHILKNRQYGYGGLAIYTSFAILAIWFPLAMAIATTLIWIGWLVIGIRMREA